MISIPIRKNEPFRSALQSVVFASPNLSNKVDYVASIKGNINLETSDRFFFKTNWLENRSTIQMALSPIDQWGILVGILLVSLIIAYVAFKELPNEDLQKLKGNSQLK
jgi:hypothetical protein